MDDGIVDWAATDGPIELLLAEHRTILQVLYEVERECRRLEAGTLREAFWQDMLRFCDAFDAGLHHQKEERLLFPALEARGLSADQGPTAVLRDEHLRIHHLRQRLETALAMRDRTRLAAAASGYVDLTRSHVLKENQILFPLAGRLLPPAELERLHREFRLLAADRRVDSWLRRPYPEVAGT